MKETLGLVIRATALAWLELGAKPVEASFRGTLFSNMLVIFAPGYSFRKFSFAASKSGSKALPIACLKLQ
jgi:hypothetical protein